IKFDHSFFIDPRKIKIKSTVPYKNLCRVTLTDSTEYFGATDRFFAAYASPIESLIVNMNLNGCIVDGLHLEHDLLNKIPRLSSFDLSID
ncbi:unnamed protein product, partial [Didymodactylos carnosus]